MRSNYRVPILLGNIITSYGIAMIYFIAIQLTKVIEVCLFVVLSTTLTTAAATADSNENDSCETQANELTNERTNKRQKTQTTNSVEEQQKRSIGKWRSVRAHARSHTNRITRFGFKPLAS